MLPSGEEYIATASVLATNFVTLRIDLRGLCVTSRFRTRRFRPTTSGIIASLPSSQAWVLNWLTNGIRFRRRTRYFRGKGAKQKTETTRFEVERWTQAVSVSTSTAVYPNAEECKVSVAHRQLSRLAASATVQVWGLTSARDAVLQL